MKSNSSIHVIVGRQSNQQFWRLLIVFALGVSFLGLSGLIAQFPQSTLEDNLYRLLALFTIDLGFTEISPDNWRLQYARFLAPMTTIAALAWVLVESIRERMALTRLKYFPPDIVVIGANKNSRSLIRVLRSTGSKGIVLMDSSPDAVDHYFCHSNRVLLIEADILDRGNLSKIGAENCRVLYAVTDDEKKNISIAEQLRVLDCDSNKTSSVTRNTFVQINSRDLFRGLYRYQRFTDNAIPFLLEAQIARDTIFRFPLYEYADLRAHQRVHAVIIGFEAQGQALTQEIALQCQYKDLQSPAITIVSLTGQGDIDTFKNSYEKINKACQLSYLSSVSGSWRDVYEDILMAEQENAITAIYIASGDESDNLAIALSVREQIDRHKVMLAPVFVQISSGHNFDDLLEPVSVTNEFHKIIQPFGVLSEVMNDSLLTDFTNEGFAQHLHKLYSTKNVVEEWASLTETKRESNRRAAAHARAKLSAIGYDVKVKPNKAIVLDPASKRLIHNMHMDWLARMEHDRWLADRYVDGWDYSPQRDDLRRFHDMLIPFQELNEDEQRKDYAHIDALLDWATNSKSQEINTRRRLTLAATGNIYLNKRESDAAKNILLEKTLPKLCDCEESIEVCLVSSLAPGADMLITEAVLEYTNKNNLAFNLIVPLPIPEQDMLADVDYARLAHKDEVSEDAKVRVQREFNDLLRKAEWVVPLYNPTKGGVSFSDQACRVLQYKKLGAYLTERADCLIAINVPHNKPGAGGTLEVVSYRRNPKDIPEAISSLPGDADGRRRPISRELVIINPVSGTEVWEV